jgi:hypothetical protein
MKNIIVIAIATLLSAGAFAQNKKEIKAATMYCCTKCDQCAAKAGSCTHHKTALVKEESYYCPMHTDVTSDKAGNCPKCGMALKKMEMKSEVKYCCAQCGLMSPVKGKCPESTEAVIKDGELKCALCYDKAGKCPKCGTVMEKVEIKKKKESKKD